MRKKTEEGISNSVVATLIVLLIFSAVYMIMATYEVDNSGQKPTVNRYGNVNSLSDEGIRQAAVSGLPDIAVEKILKGDLNSDGFNDAVVLVKQCSSGCQNGIIAVRNVSNVPQRASGFITGRRMDTRLDKNASTVDVVIDLTGIVKVVSANQSKTEFEVAFFRLDARGLTDVTAGGL